MREKLEQIRMTRLQSAKVKYDQFCSMVDRTMLTFNTGSKEVDNDLYAKQNALALEKKREAKELYEQEVKEINAKIDLMLTKL